MDSRLAWFEKLYDTHADAVFRHIYLRLGDRERAKELVQDVFMRAWQYIMLGNNIEHEKAFLFRAAHNAFINEIRSRREKYSLERLQDKGFEASDTGDSPERESEQRELMRRLTQLKESYREVLIMRYIDGLPVVTIAEILSENETNISMRIKRGLDALRNMYDGPLPKYSETHL
jgi:RNA polymerase sigma-70 factor (ECF subfamily)